jgi:VWFA-related protein
MKIATFAVSACLMATVLAEQPPAAPPQLPQPRPPIFRGGAHYVRVDAYPVTKDGKIVEGLTRDDFEIYEDGKPQAIDSSEFVAFDSWTPEGERKDPRNQQDAYDLAGDPKYRVFVVVLDPAAYNFEGTHYLRVPLHNFLERNLGPRDLFGLLSTEQEWTDLVLGQTTSTANKIIDSDHWLDPDRMTDKYWVYVECGMESMIGRRKLDDTYALLEGLVKLLGLIRQERKGIVFVSNGMATPGISGAQSMSGGGEMPRIGIKDGRIGELTRGDHVGGNPEPNFCNTERLRLQNIDFAERFRDLLRDARAANVAFYPVSPRGLQTLPFSERGGVDMPAYHAQNRMMDTLKTLASETGGMAVVNTNDLAGGLKRVSADMQAYYVLGYYTTNSTWDGRVRSIKVKLKPKGTTIRARSQYRAPTQAEITAITNPPPPRTPTAEDIALTRMTEKAAGAVRVTSESPAALVGEPSLFRNGKPAAALICARTERVRVEWPLLGAVETKQIRLLDRRAQPMAIPMSLLEPGSSTVATELALAPLARGEYIVELVVGHAGATERKLVGLRVE